MDSSATFTSCSLSFDVVNYQILRSDIRFYFQLHFQFLFCSLLNPILKVSKDYLRMDVDLKIVGPLHWCNELT